MCHVLALDSTEVFICYINNDLTVLENQGRLIGLLVTITSIVNICLSIKSQILKVEEDV